MPKFLFITFNQATRRHIPKYCSFKKQCFRKFYSAAVTDHVILLDELRAFNIALRMSGGKIHLRCVQSVLTWTYCYWGPRVDAYIYIYIYIYVHVCHYALKWYIHSFIHSVICLTTGTTPLPKRFLHIVRSRASSWYICLIKILRHVIYRPSTGPSFFVRH